MKQYIYLVVFISTFLFAAEVEIYLECDKKPFSYCEDGKVKGVSTDIIKAIFSRIKDYTVVIKPIQSNETAQKMKNKEIMMLGNMVATDKSTMPFVAEYTESYVEKRINLFCNNKIDDTLKVWPDDFHNLKIAKQNGYILPHQVVLNKAIKNNNLKIINGDLKTNIMSLIEGKVDCYIDAQMVIRGELMELATKNESNKELLEKIKKIEKIYLKTDKSIDTVQYRIGFSSVHFPLRKDLITKINLAINIMRNTDETGEIIEKYLDIYANPDKKMEVSASIFNLGNLVSGKIDVNGVMSSVISSAFENSDIIVNYNVAASPANAFLLTKWGKTCITFPWFTSSEREYYMYVSDPIASSTISLFYNNTIFHDGIKYKTIEDLRAYKIGIAEDASYKRILNQNDVYYTEYTRIENAISDLLLGEIDIFLSNKSVFLYTVDEVYPDKVSFFSRAKDNFIKKNYHVLFSKKCANSKEILAKFNKGLKKITDSGEVDSILKRFDVSKKIYYGYDDDDDNTTTTIITDLNTTYYTEGEVNVK